MNATIDVLELRVGMYVHLDLGWMAHPFPRSNFKLGSVEQIAEIRALGLQRIRWSPDKSDPPPPAESAPGLLSPPLPPALPDVDEPKVSRREALADQRAAQSLMERQYANAAGAWREANSRVVDQPAAARLGAEALTSLLLDKMPGDHDLCIRLLAEGAGDRAAAHALNVAILSLLMGRVFGFGEAEMLDLGLGALLHDIGKHDLPVRLHEPEEGASAAELGLYREHVANGLRHGRRMALTPGVLQVIEQHHEQADGSGFPQQLPLEKMCGAARIVALVNRYDNLCNPLLASKALTPHEALSVLFAQGRHKFDPTMMAGFVRMMGVYPPGSLVQLTDNRYGMVLSANSSRPLKPRVLVHDAKVQRDDALHVDLEREPELGIRRSLKSSQVPTATLHYLAPARRIAYFFEPAGVPLAAKARQPIKEHRS